MPAPPALRLLTGGTAPDDVARLLLTATPATRLGITALSLEEVFSRLVGTHRAENPAASRTA